MAIKTSETHPIRVDFINTEKLTLPGRIGLTFAPGKKQHPAQSGPWDRDLEQDLKSLRQEWHTDVLVSLLEEHEFEAVQITKLRERAEAYRIKFLWFPIRDTSVLTSIEQFAENVNLIIDALREGQTVVIHCMDGLGRAGLVAASCLVMATRLTPQEAIAEVRQARKGTIETAEQEQYVMRLAEYLAQRKASRTSAVYAGSSVATDLFPSPDVSSPETVVDAPDVKPQSSTRDTVSAYIEAFPSIRLGQEFHGLYVHSLLGEGNMGAAYLASHPILQMPLVIKTFKTTSQSTVFTEAHLAARVISPNVVSVLDAGYESDIPFVVQRYVDGIDLHELIKHVQEAGWRLPINTVCRILIDAARGLHAIHQAGVIHRDVKPANLFLQGNGVTTVGDFGIAMDVVNDEGKHLSAGTPLFMAPEQWLGQPLGWSTDLYALGVTGHLLATDHLPFAANTTEELKEVHVHRPYVAPMAVEPREAYLFAVIERMLRKRPEERFSTGEELARTLQVITEDPPRFITTGDNEARVGPVQVILTSGNLAQSIADVIVNASHAGIVMDMGVAQALRRQAEPVPEQQALAHGIPRAMGDVIWTEAGKLRARWMAHAVAAINGAVCVQRCTLRVLLGAEIRGAEVVCFRSLGTGAGQVPVEMAAKLSREWMGDLAARRPRQARAVRRG